MADDTLSGQDPACADVLEFWFGHHADDAETIAQKSPIWFRGGPAVDAAIGERFSVLREAAIAGRLDAWLDSAHGRLALVILVDQFSRNLFRNDARAFEHDALARRWCDEGLRIGADRALRPIERLFFYLPLEHSEALPDQERAVALFAALRDEVRVELKASFDGFLDYAERHREVIARFGRFPHRNAALSRASSAEEASFLEQPGSSF